VEIGGTFNGCHVMKPFFFSGCTAAKLDEKNRFVLPQHLRYGLVENGQLEFVLALGVGGCLSIYRKSEIEKLVAKFQSKLHIVKYQKFFTLFFSTLHITTCDKVGRLLIPPILRKAAKLDGDIVIAGVMNKIEIWPKAKYEFDLESFLEEGSNLEKLTEEAFSLIEEPTLDEEFNELTDTTHLRPVGGDIAGVSGL